MERLPLDVVRQVIMKEEDSDFERILELLEMYLPDGVEDRAFWTLRARTVLEERLEADEDDTLLVRYLWVKLNKKIAEHGQENIYDYNYDIEQLVHYALVYDEIRYIFMGRPRDAINEYFAEEYGSGQQQHISYDDDNALLDMMLQKRNDDLDVFIIENVIQERAGTYGVVFHSIAQYRWVSALMHIYMYQNKRVVVDDVIRDIRLIIRTVDDLDGDYESLIGWYIIANIEFFTFNIGGPLGVRALRRGIRNDEVYELILMKLIRYEGYQELYDAFRREQRR